MNEQEYKKQLAQTVMMFSRDIVDIVHQRIETYALENHICKECRK